MATEGKGGSSNLRLDDDDQHCGHGSTLITAEEKSPFFFFIVVFQGNGRAAAYAHTHTAELLIKRKPQKKKSSINAMFTKVAQIIDISNTGL